MNKSEKEVLFYLFDRTKYPLPDKKKKNKFGIIEGHKRHSNAFCKLRDAGLTCLDENRIWDITELGKKKIISENLLGGQNPFLLSGNELRKTENNRKKY